MTDSWAWLKEIEDMQDWARKNEALTFTSRLLVQYEIPKLFKAIHTLREALEEYSQPIRWGREDIGYVYRNKDGGDKAREALEKCAKGSFDE